MGCSGSKNATEDAKSKTLMTKPVQKDQTDGNQVAEPETEMAVQPEAEGPKASPLQLDDSAKEDLVKLLNNAFDRMDVNGDGFVSREELAASLDLVLQCSHVKSRKSIRTLLAESGLNPYLNTFDQLDTNHDGKISRDEFQANMHPSKAAKNVEQILKGVFESIDTNKDGSLDRAEVSRAFADLLTKSCVKSQKTIKALIMDAGLNPDLTFDELDANKDGKITWEEFREKLQPAFDAFAFLKSVFKQLDANADGAVSREELAGSIERILDCSDMKSKKSFRNLLQESGLNTEFYLFEQLDADGNGSITWDELEVLLKPAAVAADRGETSTNDVALTEGTPGLRAVEQTVLVEAAPVQCVCGWW
jgi:Ca2+-binding EF-hand superfamily protein